eukprot:1001061_1
MTDQIFASIQGAKQQDCCSVAPYRGSKCCCCEVKVEDKDKYLPGRQRSKTCQHPLYPHLDVSGDGSEGVIIVRAKDGISLFEGYKPTAVLKLRDGKWEKPPRLLNACGLPPVRPGIRYVHAEMPNPCQPGGRLLAVCETAQVFSDLSRHKILTCDNGEWAGMDLLDEVSCEEPCHASDLTHPDYAFSQVDELSPSGTQVLASCKNGIFEDRTTSKIVQCVNGKWNIHELPKRKASCPVPTENSQMVATSIPGTIATDGSKYVLKCKNGQLRRKDTGAKVKLLTVSCNDGVWSHDPSNYECVASSFIVLRFLMPMSMLNQNNFLELLEIELADALGVPVTRIGVVQSGNVVYVKVRPLPAGEVGESAVDLCKKLIDQVNAGNFPESS